jgi:hypothetical protein
LFRGKDQRTLKKIHIQRSEIKPVLAQIRLPLDLVPNDPHLM